MKYTSAYRILDKNDKGLKSTTDYLLVNCAGYYRFDKSNNVRHRKNGRNDFLIVYIHDGQAMVKSKGQDYKLEPGNIFIYHPNEEQYYGQVNNHPVENYWVHFTGFGVDNVLEKLKLNKNNIFSVGVNSQIPAIIKMIMKETYEKKDNYELFSASLLLELLTLASRNINKNPDKMTSKINTSLNYINYNYMLEELSVIDLASMSGFCVNRFIAIFKEITGMSPKQYIINMKIQKAKELLSETNLSIKQIASLVGCNDQLYFSRLFKQKEGVCPREWREFN